MAEEGNYEFKYQAGKFVLILNGNIDAMKKYHLYDDHLHRGIKA